MHIILIDSTGTLLITTHKLSIIMGNNCLTLLTTITPTEFTTVTTHVRLSVRTAQRLG